MDDVDFVVTGASGWLGQATLEYLLKKLGPQQRGRIHAFAASAEVLTLRDGSLIRARPLASLPDLRTQHPAVVFHYAFQTKDKVGAKSFADYIQLNRGIRDTLANFVAANRIAGLFVPSSGAAYAGMDESNLSDGAIYGRCKLDDERSFAAMGQHYGFTVVSPRVFNVSGPYINKHSLYALASIISACLSDEPITVRAKSPVIRSYYSVMDLIELCTRLMLAQREKAAMSYLFDTAGVEVVEIGELASRCQRLLAPHLIVERPPIGQAPADFYVGDSAAIRAFEQTLGITPVGLDQQILLTADYMNALLQSGRP